MRNDVRVVRVAGNRLTGTLTSPNVMVPDQNGRTPEFSSPVTVDSEVRFPFLLAFELLLGSVFSFLQSGNALSEYAIE